MAVTKLELGGYMLIKLGNLLVLLSSLAVALYEICMINNS